MLTTLDGKIITEHWRNEPWGNDYDSLFEKYHKTFNAEAWILGRVSLEKDFSGGLQPEPIEPEQPIKREPFIGDPDAKSFAIAVDRHGKLGWDSNEIDGDHIVELLTEQVSDAYLNYLQKRKISYLFAGNEELDFKIALEQLANLFPIKTLMLEGGGHLNGSFLNEGMIDELSLLLIPVADGTAQTTSLFEVNKDQLKNPASLFKLKDVKQVEAGTLWMRYSIQKTKNANG